MPLGLDVGTVGNREAEPAEDLHRAVDQQGQRVKRSGLRRGAGQGGIDGSEGGGIGGRSKRSFLIVKGGRDGGTQFIEELPHDGALFLGKGAHPLAQQGDRSGLPEVADARLFQGNSVGRFRNRGERLDPKLLDLGFHGVIRGKPGVSA